MTALSSHLQVNSTNIASAKIRTNLAFHHLFAACRFSARVGEIESINVGQPFGPFWDEILQNSLGVATLTVAALESYSNELYFEGAILKPGLNAAAAAELAEIIDRESILKKYSVALSMRTDKRLDCSISVTENINALIDLRNAVVHFRPEWLGEEGRHGKLSKILKYKFKPSDFFPSEPVFPRAWASHSFTIWALKTTVEFIDYFDVQAGLPSALAPFKENLKSLSAGAL